jgi:hypothetical protein
MLEMMPHQHFKKKNGSNKQIESKAKRLNRLPIKKNGNLSF